MTDRQLEVYYAIEGGARSFDDIAELLDPPISKRTARKHVADIAGQLPSDFEPQATPLWRVVMWSRRNEEEGVAAGGNAASDNSATPE